MPVCVVWDERAGLRFCLNTSLTFVFVFFSPSSPLLLSVSIHFLSQLEYSDETTGYLRDNLFFYIYILFAIWWRRISCFISILFENFVFVPCSSPHLSILLVSNFHPCIFFIYFFPAAPLSPFHFCFPQSSVFCACISFFPMYFSFCSLIYFSIFIIHHLPVNFLSPHQSLHSCLLQGNVSAV